MASQPLLSHTTGALGTPSLVIGIDQGHDNLHSASAELANFTTLLQGNGVTVTYNSGNFSQTFLSSINALLIPPPARNFTAGELTLLSNWYAVGGKLWLSAAYENPAASANLNALLRKINSSLGFEYGYVLDTTFNVNSTTADSSDVILPLINHQEGSALELTLDLRTLYAYRPVPVVSYSGTSPVKLSSLQKMNLISLAQTASSGKIYNSTTLLVYTTGESSAFPVVVTEKAGASKLLLTGYTPFSDWKKTFEYIQDKPNDNRLLVRNLLKWLVGFSATAELEALLPQIHVANRPQVIIDTESSNVRSSSAELSPLIMLLSDLGFDVRTTGAYGNDTLKSASTVVIQAPRHFALASERNALRIWLSQKNKTLVLSGIADYSLVGGSPESGNLNAILASLGSSLRFEQGALNDLEANIGGSSYLNQAASLNRDTWKLGNLTRNVRSLILQYPTILVGWNGTGYVPLENRLLSFTNVTWISRASNASIIQNLDTSFPLLAHKAGDKGPFITGAIEETKNGSRLILIGGPIFTGSGQLLSYPTVYGFPADNIIFQRNLFSRYLSSTSIGTEMNVTNEPSQLFEGGTVTLRIEYDALHTSATDPNRVQKIPVAPANFAISVADKSPTAMVMPDGSYSASVTLPDPGQQSWRVTASSRIYQSQVASGSIQVKALPARFVPYVLTVPIILFIAVTVFVILQRTRRLRP